MTLVFVIELIKLSFFRSEPDGPNSESRRIAQVLNRSEMADDSPQRHEEIPQLTNEDADAWHYQDIGEEDVTGHLTEFVDCGEQPDEDGAPLPVSEGVNPGVLACPQVWGSHKSRK